MDKKEAKLIVGGLSQTTKMPCKSYNTPAEKCQVGSKLRMVTDSVCSDCYACKGMYRFSNVQKALVKRFSSLDNPKWCEAMIVLIKGMPFFRWHDSGDIQSVEHLDNIMTICSHTCSTKHWLPTREYKYVKEFWEKHGKIPLSELIPNLSIRLSGMMIDGRGPKDLAIRLGCTISEVGRSKIRVTCPAHNQDNQCKDCRKCWDNDTMNVVYNYH